MPAMDENSALCESSINTDKRIRTDMLFHAVIQIRPLKLKEIQLFCCISATLTQMQLKQEYIGSLTLWQGNRLLQYRSFKISNSRIIYLQLYTGMPGKSISPFPSLL